MKKLSLDLESIAVESFAVDGGADGRAGSVRAHEDSLSPGGTGGEETCGLTCPATCAPSCGETCFWTCAENVTRTSPELC